MHTAHNVTGGCILYFDVDCSLEFILHFIKSILLLLCPPCKLIMLYMYSWLFLFIHVVCIFCSFFFLYLS